MVPLDEELVRPGVAELLLGFGWYPYVLAGVSLQVWDRLVIWKGEELLGTFVHGSEKLVIVTRVFGVDPQTEVLQQLLGDSLLDRVGSGLWLAARTHSIAGSAVMLTRQPP